jgi:hypothetical protein
LKLLGVDAGKSGAFAFLDTADNSIHLEDVPLNSDGELDAALAFEWMLEREPSLVLVEDCWRPKSLVLMCGEIAALAKLLQADFRRVAVRSWKTAMTGQYSNDKTLSVNTCKRLAPQAQLRKPRARTDSADRAEAVLLALYGSRLGGPCSG